MLIIEAFGVLGLDINAGLNEIKAAYRAHCFNQHPDHGGDVDQFSRLNDAYTSAIEFAKNAPCPQCNGTGTFAMINAAMRLTPVSCPRCDGTGRRSR